MAMCNTIRLLAVSVALVVVVQYAEGFSFRRTTTLRRAADLYPDETRAADVREIRVTNAHNGNVAYDARNETITIPNMNKVSGEKKTNEAPAAPPKKKTFQAAVTTYKPIGKTGDRDVNNKAIKVPADADSKSPNKKMTHLQSKNTTNKSTEIMSNEKTREKVYEKQAASLPSWKKYTFINRNKVEDAAPNLKDKSVKVNAPEVAYSASSLRDTITSDIPSLEKLKNDLLSTTVTNSKPKLLGQKPATSKAPLESKTNENSKWSVESKRAGYLDYSEKNKELEVAVLNSNSAKVEKPQNIKQESPNHQMKDSLIKEILLAETVDNNVKKGQEANQKIEKSKSPPQIPNIENSEKQTTIEKSKNASLYAVSPNYKPLKKLEVQPPKPFVRDPDDNSWRNESISSLGIVFKPKNSSKAFTQVLKNKTESEWNSLLERERKNDIPDLRERLEQMTKMRKTKRKKIDSMGNVVYVDYEENVTSNENTNENNNSNENNNPLQGDIIIPLLSFDPQFLLSGSKIPGPTFTDLPKTDPYTTTVATNVNKETTMKARKPKKNYNIPDYYESSEDEDLDYLNLAKIDIKKFATQKTTQTPFDTTTWPVTTFRNTNGDANERKSTVQYFPPLRNKKIHIINYNPPRDQEINKYINPIDQANFVSTRKPTTNYVPIPYPETNVPLNDKYSPYGVNSFDELHVTNKPTTIGNDIYFRPPPRIDEQTYEHRLDEQRIGEPTMGEHRLGEQRIEEHRIGDQRIDQRIGDHRIDHRLGEHRIEQPRIEEPRIEEPRLEEPRIEEPRIEVPRIEPMNRFKVVSDEGNPNRGSYVIKSYDDFINEAEKANEFDSQLEFGPYTEATSESVTTADLMKPNEQLTEDLDYDAKFRKDVLSRFVENFNRNTAKLKSDFPIIFNSSIVHDTHGDGKELASSRAFLRGLHGVTHERRQNKKYNLYDTAFNATAEVPPTFEFHYFMPDQDKDGPPRYKL